MKEDTGQALDWLVYSLLSLLSLSLFYKEKRLHDEGPQALAAFHHDRKPTKRPVEDGGPFSFLFLFFMGGLYLGRKGHALVCRLTVFQTRPASWAARFPFFRSPGAQKNSSLSKSSQSVALTTMDRARSCCVCKCLRSLHCSTSFFVVCSQVVFFFLSYHPG